MARVEIIAIGDELLKGEIDNTTAPFIREQIASFGFELEQITTVGDEIGRIVKAIRGAEQDHEIVILTGGLGPTPDDLTREALATAIDRPLEFGPNSGRRFNDCSVREEKKLLPPTSTRPTCPIRPRQFPTPREQPAV